MHKLFEMLESKGFVSEDHIHLVDDLPSRHVSAFYEALYSEVFTAQYPDASLGVGKRYNPDPFSFMASASMRGDSGCSYPTCRIQKLDFLANFAALYANHVTVPIPLRHPDNLTNEEESKEDLNAALTSLFALRPLIENGLVQPVTMRTVHCEHAMPVAKRMRDIVHSAAEWGAQQAQHDFKVSYQPPERSPSGRSTIYVEGPNDYLEHGSLVCAFDDDGSFRAKSWKYDKDGCVEVRGRKKLYFIDQIFSSIANDTTFYLAYGLLHRSRLLTDKPGDAFLLNWLTEDESLQATSAAMEFLSHSIPLLTDIPLSTLIRIRKEERDSFESYRRAISALTMEVLAVGGELTAESAKEAFKTKLEPQIEKVKIEVSAERKRQTRRLSVGLGV